MPKKTSIPGTIDAWESRALGASAAHVKRAAAELQAEIDEKVGLQAISIRLPKSTIDVYKALAKLHGVGYQPLMRDAICRWADAELKQMAIGAAEAQRKQGNGGPTDAPPPVKKAA